MITIEDARGTELTKAQASEISKQTKPLTVGALELALLAQFPRTARACSSAIRQHSSRAWRLRST